MKRGQARQFTDEERNRIRSCYPDTRVKVWHICHGLRCSKQRLYKEITAMGLQLRTAA
jgi:hypothetical protein